MLAYQPTLFAVKVGKTCSISLMQCIRSDTDWIAKSKSIYCTQHHSLKTNCLVATPIQGETQQACPVRRCCCLQLTNTASSQILLHKHSAVIYWPCILQFLFQEAVVTASELVLMPSWLLLVCFASGDTLRVRPCAGVDTQHMY